MPAMVPLIIDAGDYKEFGNYIDAVIFKWSWLITVCAREDFGAPSQLHANCLG
jgi:hypothetical protein